MNKIDIKNMKSILKWRELERKVKIGPKTEVGGEINLEAFTTMADEEIKEKIKEFETSEKKSNTSEIRSLVDTFFEKWGDEGDNMIVLSGAWVPERETCELEDPVNVINWDWSNYNKLYHAVGRQQPSNQYFAVCDLPEAEREEREKLWGEFADDMRPILKAANSLKIPTAEKYWKNNNDALNECWYGVIGIMKDYRVVSFVIRDDGLLCDKGGYETFYNSIIMNL